LEPKEKPRGYGLWHPGVGMVESSVLTRAAKLHVARYRISVAIVTWAVLGQLPLLSARILTVALKWSPQTIVTAESFDGRG
jgi:hypothetical protein